MGCSATSAGQKGRAELTLFLTLPLPSLKSASSQFIRVRTLELELLAASSSEAGWSPTTADGRAEANSSTRWRSADRSRGPNKGSLQIPGISFSHSSLVTGVVFSAWTQQSGAERRLISSSSDAKPVLPAHYYPRAQLE